MGKKVGRMIALSTPRRLIGDLLHYSHQIPTVPVQRRMNLADMGETRALAPQRVSWCAIFTKAWTKTALIAGTFGVTVYAGLGAESLHLLAPTTTTMNYGMAQADGNVLVRIVYDHRVLDGLTIARTLAFMEEVLHQDVVQELRDGVPGRAA